MNESTLVPRKEWESDLDWLARNVHEWPYELQTHCYVMTGKGGKKEFSASAYSPFFSKFTKDQWLARREELQNKPGFAYHPDAKFLVQMSWGGWFKNKSDVTLERRGEKATLDSCGAFEFIRSGEVLGDWRDTLEKRPEQKELEPFVSVEDAKISILQRDGDVKHFGGIIGRNLLPEEYAATAKQQAITPSKYTKTIRGVSVDVYDVLQAWGVSNPALQHLIKKALQCGQRGHKDSAQDMQDIIDSAIRAKELES